MAIGSLSEQQGSTQENYWRDCQPDISGCSEIQGPYAYLAHDLVSSSSNRPLPDLPLPHHGTIHLYRICNLSVNDSIQFLLGVVD